PATFFFPSRRRLTRFSGDWSSDVCSPDLPPTTAGRSKQKRHIRCLSYRLITLTKPNRAPPYQKQIRRTSRRSCPPCRATILGHRPVLPKRQRLKSFL